MIRHFFRSPCQRFASEIGLLPFRVIQVSLLGFLVIAVVLAAVPAPGLPTASLAAVTLTAFAMAADKEHFAAERAKRPSEYKL